MHPEPQPSSGTLDKLSISPEHLRHAVKIDARVVAEYISHVENSNALLSQVVRDVGFEGYRNAQTALSLLDGGSGSNNNWLNHTTHDFGRLLDSLVTSPGGLARIPLLVPPTETTTHQNVSPTSQTAAPHQDGTLSSSKPPLDTSSKAQQAATKVKSPSTIPRLNPESLVFLPNIMFGNPSGRIPLTPVLPHPSQNFEKRNLHEMPIKIVSLSDVIQLKADRPGTPPALQIVSPITPIHALDINQSEQESSTPPPSSPVASPASQIHVSTPRSPLTNASGASNVIQSKPANPVPRCALQVTSPNTVSRSPPKLIPQFNSENFKPIPLVARNISGPANQSFISFLNNKIQADKKAAQDRAILKILDSKVDTTKFIETSSKSRPSPQLKGAGQVTNLTIAEFLDIDRTNYVQKQIAILDEMFKGVCPTSLSTGRCTVGCTMQKLCKNYPRATCHIANCINLHQMRTCEWEAKGIQCKAVNTKGADGEWKHMVAVVHQDGCDHEEWKQRMSVAKLVNAHNDGRYRS